LAFVLGACAGPTSLVAAEGVRSPEPPPPEFAVSIIAGDDLTPLVATVTATEREPAVTDATGSLVMEWNDRWATSPGTLTAAAPGFLPGTATLRQLPEEPVEIRLDPVVVEGRVLTPDGRPLPAANVTLNEQEVITDARGEFLLTRVEPGEIAVTRPAWEPASTSWDGDPDPVEITLAPLMIYALRVGGDKAGDPNAWNELLELADTTAVNAFVVDTKEESGTVMRDTEVGKAYDIGAVREFYDLDDVIADMDAHGLYKITRIVTFQDGPLAAANPEIAARNTRTGGVWTNDKGLGWLDPTDRESWEYALELAEESCRRGFDEIQFDYVRFPSDGPVAELSFDELSSDDYYGDAAQQKRVETIAAFLGEAHRRLNPMGCAVAADIFAITLESTTDEGIGQSPAALSNAVDVLSPMIYTYTYGPGWKGFDDPNDHPIEIVTGALDAGIPRLEGFSIYRPWLQRAFLEDAEILDLVDVAEERGLGWMLWSATTAFNSTMLPAER
jgi:hypothetical protein